MRLKGLDLNLLITLDVLLEERSVSRTADRLFLSQPAVSGALQRLREFFKDPILVQHGKQMLPTAHAKELQINVKRLLNEAERLISLSSQFNPSTSDRRFSMMASDYISTVLLVPLANKLAKIAPGISLDIIMPSSQVSQSFERGEIDLMLVPEQFTSKNHPSELIFQEKHVIVGWNQNPLFQNEITEKAFYDAAHVAVRIGPNSQKTFIEQQLDGLQIERKIEIYAPSFSSMLWFVLNTNRIGVMHERLAQFFISSIPITIAPIPLEISHMNEMLQYHATKDTDAGLQWLRKAILQAAAEQIQPR